MNSVEFTTYVLRAIINGKQYFKKFLNLNISCFLHSVLRRKKQITICAVLRDLL